MVHALDVMWRDAPVGAPLTALVGLGLLRVRAEVLRAAVPLALLIVVLTVLALHSGHGADAMTAHRG